MAAMGGRNSGLRYGMVGGGRGAFIGEVHRKAIAMDGLATLMAGCFSRSLDNTLETGRGLGLDEARLYQDYREMARGESARPDGIDFVVIVTPNHTHHDMARTFLNHGMHVVCDKPLALEVEEAEELATLAREKGVLFCVTYTYTGYPMVRHARELIRQGALGELRFVNAEYAQDWLAERLETTGHKQAAWRLDPSQTGVANSMGDIGTHVENLAAHMTGLRMQRLCARLDSFVPGRELDDNGSVMVEYEGGARGLYWCSQVAVGNANGLRIRVFGSRGGLEWSHECPDQLTLHHLDRPTEILVRGRPGLTPMARSMVRIPAGHPEGYFEAFANIYQAFALALARVKQGLDPDPGAVDFPTVEQGVRGVRFIHACVESSKQGSVWVEL